MFDTLLGKNTINFVEIYQEIQSNPWEIIPVALDVVAVVFLIYLLIKVSRKSKVWQLLKGIFILVVITILSGVFKMRITNFIFTTIMTYGVIALIIIFQPELRRGLEQLGATNTFKKWFGLNINKEEKTKEDIYKVAIAVEEMAKTKTGALIVFERDIKLQDIIDTGIEMDSEISPRVLCNIFVPNTPLHDGAVIISNNKISAAACILPLAENPEIEKKFGTRHRAAIGMSKESDAIVVVVSEETGEISIARDGQLIVDVEDETLKRLLIKHLVLTQYGSEAQTNRVMRLKKRVKDRKDRLKLKKNLEKENNNIESL